MTNIFYNGNVFCVRDCSGNPFLCHPERSRRVKHKKDCNGKPDPCGNAQIEPLKFLVNY